MMRSIAALSLGLASLAVCQSPEPHEHSQGPRWESQQASLYSQARCSYEELQVPPRHALCGEPSLTPTGPRSSVVVTNGDLSACVRECMARSKCMSFSHDADLDVCRLSLKSRTAAALHDAAPSVLFWERDCFSQWCDDDDTHAPTITFAHQRDVSHGEPLIHPASRPLRGW